MDVGRGIMRRRLALAIFAGVALWAMPAAAEWSASLPMFAACKPATPPELPQRWRAVGLMLPFLQGQLDVGEFVYDAALPAMRATVYGLESGAVDLLITDNDTYVLSGPHAAPTHCASMGPKLRPPSPQWLASESVCVGEAPLGSQAVQWWQKGGFEPARYWISSETRLPWRTSFVSRALDPTIVGDYAMTYFAAFTPLPQTNLAALRDQCAATAKHGSAEAAAGVPTARELMAIGNDAAEAERKERIAELIPGVSHGACARATPLRWPDRFVMTAMVTPIKMNDTPSSALIYYDWTEAQTQLILPFQGRPPVLQGVISLKPRLGYRLRHRSSGANDTCAADLPGIVRPDWMTAASCECKAVLAQNSALSSHAPSEILSCPIKGQGGRIMWSWYETDGRPIMFVEAAPQSGGVMLADYNDWVPGQTGKAADFALPDSCAAVTNSGHSQAVAAPSFSNTSCSDCHTTTW
jgi:hypothetical protein